MESNHDLKIKSVWWIWRIVTPLETDRRQLWCRHECNLNCMCDRPSVTQTCFCQTKNLSVYSTFHLAWMHVKMQPLHSVTTCWYHVMIETEKKSNKLCLMQKSHFNSLFNNNHRRHEMCIYRDILHIRTPCRASNEPSKLIKKCERKLNKGLRNELWKRWFLTRCQSRKKVAQNVLL